MNTKELKETMIAQNKVVHKGIVYKKINALIYRFDGKTIRESAELLDQTHRMSITTVRGKEIKTLMEYKTETEQKMTEQCPTSGNCYSCYYSTEHEGCAHNCEVCVHTDNNGDCLCFESVNKAICPYYSAVESEK